jgi:hypothetical protein
VEALDIHPLSAEQQARYSSDWTVVQERFVDAPTEAVTAAHTLVWDVMRDRGYPADDSNASIEALSVYHARSLEGYRNSRNLRTESATTEQLREALINYRGLFEDLTGLRGRPARVREAQLNANSDLAAQNGDLTAQDGDLATENTDRTADTPR